MVRMRAETSMNILAALKKEQAQLAKKLGGVAAAIAALGGKRVKAKRKMSAAARKKISATQKANWRKKRAGK
jgi:CO dehydrogenase nickel-insertion accessory protein CooC1